MDCPDVTAKFFEQFGLGRYSKDVEKYIVGAALIQLGTSNVKFTFPHAFICSSVQCIGSEQGKGGDCYGE